MQVSQYLAMEAPRSLRHTSCLLFECVILSGVISPITGGLPIFVSVLPLSLALWCLLQKRTIVVKKLLHVQLHNNSFCMPGLGISGNNAFINDMWLLTPGPIIKLPFNS